MSELATLDGRDVDLAGLIGARICHDLISPIGAIGNGLELLELSGASAHAPEMTLVAESQRACVARIGFFRVVFGPAGADALIAPTDAGRLIADFARDGRTSPVWRVETALSRAELRFGFLAYLCLDTALPRRCSVEMRHEGGRWQLLTQGALPRLDKALWGGLTAPGQTLEVTPATVQFALLAEAARTAGRDIRLDVDAEAVTLFI
ncbi:histidine phosphotransferase ChpT [Roseivivax halotolerans]|uniref:Histidine phosphotransferase ChpT n=1 Tax=Roseivivax halotolerans TaxID=93684 RepID=A0A1I5XEC3_9RHOB|nr:histidine phosphotransferase family protein [Roseivivax halotolerans]SFQ30333.1 histidine phosphotransferase ChpT [Roseivivax halotolerans]